MAVSAQQNRRNEPSRGLSEIANLVEIPLEEPSWEGARLRVAMISPARCDGGIMLVGARSMNDLVLTTVMSSGSTFGIEFDIEEAGVGLRSRVVRFSRVPRPEGKDGASRVWSVTKDPARMAV
jgi:hypothetical protein